MSFVHWSNTQRLVRSTQALTCLSSPRSSQAGDVIVVPEYPAKKPGPAMSAFGGSEKYMNSSPIFTRAVSHSPFRFQWITHSSSITRGS